MVYRGKLSRSCAHCRKRKLKCDLRPSGCGQCARAKLDCSGYRDITALRINDESQMVKKKYESSSTLQISSVYPQVKEPLLDHARNAFFHHYVTNDLRTYSYLQSFYPPGGPPTHLSVSVDSVSLAYFAHWKNSPSALEQAKVEYISALQYIHTAVKSRKTVQEDATLLAAMFLDLFEKMTNNTPMSEDAWVSHVRGAFTLVQCRGRNQFERPISVRMLLRLCTSFLISCVISSRPIPIELIELRAELAKYIDCNNPKWRLMGIMVHFVELKLAEANSSVSDERIVELAKKVDSQLQGLTKDMPPSWQYEIVQVQHQSANIYGDFFHVYSDMHVTQTNNVLRLTRIFVNEIIQNHTRSLQDPRSLEIQLSGNEISDLASKICASVPQYTIPATQPKFQPETSNELPPSMTCYTLLFPLFVVARSPSVSSSMKTWIMSQLRYMSQVVGIKNAEAVLKILNEGHMVDPWSVYAMLGSYAFVA